MEVEGKPFDEASKEGVLKLLKYVGGSNDKGERPGVVFKQQCVTLPLG